MPGSRFASRNTGPFILAAQAWAKQVVMGQRCGNVGKAPINRRSRSPRPEATKSTDSPAAVRPGRIVLRLQLEKSVGDAASNLPDAPAEPRRESELVKESRLM